MNEKYKRFCEEYMIDNNGMQAAIRVGYSEKRANVTACELLNKQEIKDYIAILRKDLAEKTKLTSEWVINRFKEISDKCMTVEPVMIMRNGQLVESGEYKFDSSGANKATEMIGKHLGVFEKDNSQKKPEVIAPETIAAIIEKINKNAAS